MKKVFLFLIIFFVFIFSAETSLAAPAISSVSGTVLNGQILTISGSGLQNNNTTGWDFAESQGSFEGSSPASDGWMMDGSPTYDTSVKLLGNKSVRSTASGTGGRNCPVDNAFGGDVYRNMSRYVRMYVRFGPNFASLWQDAAYQKMIEYVSPSGIYIQPATGGSTITELMTLATVNRADMNLSPAWTVNKWYCVEWYAAPTGLTIWVDGVNIGTNTSALNYGSPFAELGIINACPVNGTYNMYIDGVMSSSNRVYPAAIVEITNSPNYDTSVKVKQAVETISDSSVGITADLAGLGSGPYYLWVTNNRQERSAGYNLAGGGGGNTAPAAPTGVKVI